MFIILTLTVTIGTNRYKENQLALIQDSMNIYAESQKVQFQQFIDDKVVVLQGLAQFSDVYEMDALSQIAFLRGKSKGLGFHHLFLMDRNGRGIYVEEVLKERSNELELPYIISTSYGYARRVKGNKDALNKTVAQADDNMYRYKESLHKQQGRDNR
uniref:hypothetical protein n=1 Tax=Acetatifactor sp. TaxID=1872090 RepID=UPI004057AF6D